MWDFLLLQILYFLLTWTFLLLYIVENNKNKNTP